MRVALGACAGLSMSGDGLSINPPKPRLVLRVGVTGKRAVTEDAAKDVRAALDNIFEALGKLLVDCRNANLDFFSKDAPLLRVISGMAEGADQIAAEAAIDAQKHSVQRKVETQLAAILPFVQEEYEKDFRRDPFQPNDAPDRRPEVTAQIVAKFSRLLGGAETVLQIDDEALRDPANKQFRDRAYENLGEVLLEHTDILIAVSNDKFGGAGGTVDVLGKALNLKIPVIKVSLVTRKVHVLHAAASDAANPAPVEEQEMVGGQLPSELADLITRTLQPPQDVAAHGSGEHGPRPARERLGTFFRETFDSRFFDRIFKAFRDAFSARPGAGERLIMKFVSGCVAFVSVIRSYGAKPKRADDAAKEMWPKELDRFAGDGGKAATTVFAVRYGWADVLAVGYADATRSVHVMLAALAASAVLMALIPLVPFGVSDQRLLEIKIVCLAIEFAILMFAWALFQPARKGRWHERFVEYRAVAELLRHERFIYALGAAGRPGRAADRTWSEPDAWVGWYVRATLRELGFPHAVISAERRRDVIKTFLENELEGPYGQIAYNKTSVAQRYNTIDRRLEKIILGGFWFTVTTAVAGVVLLAAYWMAIPPAGMTASMKHHLHTVKPVLTIIAAFIPALIAALHGIRFQIDFRGTATRAESTMRELEEVAREIRHALESGSLGRKQSLSLLRDANDAMSADVAGWLSVYRGKGPEL